MTERALFAAAGDMTPDFAAVERLAIATGRAKLVKRRALAVLTASAAALAIVVSVMLLLKPYGKKPPYPVVFGTELDGLAVDGACAPDGAGLVLPGGAGCSDTPGEDFFLASSPEEVTDDIRIFRSVAEAEKLRPQVEKYLYGYSFAGFPIENPDETYRQKTRALFSALLDRLSVPSGSVTQTVVPEGFRASYPGLLPTQDCVMAENTFFEVEDADAADGHPVYYIQANIRGTVVCCSAKKIAVRQNGTYDDAEALTRDPFFSALRSLCGGGELRAFPLRDASAPAFGFYDAEESERSEMRIRIRYVGGLGILTAFFPGDETETADDFPAADLNEALRFAVKKMKDAGFGGLSFAGGRFITAATSDGTYGVPVCRFFFTADSLNGEPAASTDGADGTIVLYCCDVPAYDISDYSPQE